MDKSIVVQLHHINGDSTDNRLENLQMLCPNCHSQTENYCGNANSNKIIKHCAICGKEITKNAQHCSICASQNRRKIKEIPNKEYLLELIQEKSFLEIGRLYNVSDNAVRK